MVTTRATSKRPPYIIYSPKIFKKKTTRAAPGSKISRRGRGRPASHNLRALVAIGMKLRMPRLELEFTVDMVNCVCDNIVNSIFPAAEETELCCRTMRKRVVALMNGATWSQLNATQHQSLWEGIVDDTIKDLVFEACDKILFEEERKEWENRNAIAVANTILAPQEQGQHLTGFEFNFDFNTNNQDFMLFSDQYVILDPQQPVQRQLFGGAVDSGCGGGGGDNHTFDDFSYMNGAEMHNNYTGTIDYAFGYQ